MARAIIILFLVGLIWLVCWSAGQFVEIKQYRTEQQKQLEQPAEPKTKLECTNSEVLMWCEQVPVEPETAFADPCGLTDVVCPAEATPNTGKASWYAKGLNAPYSEATAASRDYPRGSRLLVTNVETGASVEVVVNDYGPQKAVHPDRIIDLSYFAFEQIGEISSGIISVKVEEL